MGIYAIYEKKSGVIEKVITIPDIYIADYPLPDGFDYSEVDEAVNDITHVIKNNLAVVVDTTTP